MTTSFILNGRRVSYAGEAGESLKTVLRRNGIISLRNGCDGEGSCGLCALLLDGKLVNSCLILAAEVEGHDVVTIDHYNKDPMLRTIQRSLIDASCVQCGYCTPAVALSLRELLSRLPEPGEAEITDALSGTLCRCTGYKQYFEAARLAAKRLADPAYVPPAGPEFRPELRHIGKDREKVDAENLARGEKSYVEDRVAPDACHLKVLGSPYAHAWVISVDTAEAEAMPGVVAVLSHRNTPERAYTTAGQGFQSSPTIKGSFPPKCATSGKGRRRLAGLPKSPRRSRA